MTTYTFTVSLLSPESMPAEAVRLIVSATLEAGLKTANIGIRLVDVKPPRTRKLKL